MSGCKLRENVTSPGMTAAESIDHDREARVPRPLDTFDAIFEFNMRPGRELWDERQQAQKTHG
jgi:hypothetical protein